MFSFLLIRKDIIYDTVRSASAVKHQTSEEIIYSIYYYIISKICLSDFHISHDKQDKEKYKKDCSG